MAELLLRVTDLDVRYGAIQALFGISLDVYAGEVVALLGANGAGKSTTLRAISGLLPVVSGSITFEGRPLQGASVEHIVGFGIAHVPEGRRVFPGLTVRENLELGAASWYRRGVSLAADIDRVFELFPQLKERQSQLGWTLSGGEQQMLAIGRGLLARPRLLLLDEPSLGLAPRLVHDLYSTIGELNRREDLTILLVEQNARMALSIAHRGYVLENGAIVLHGAVEELGGLEDLEAAYLGTSLTESRSEAGRTMAAPEDN